MRTETCHKEESKEENVVVIASRLVTDPELHPVECFDAEESTTQEGVAVVRFSPTSSQGTYDTAIQQLNTPQLFEPVMDSNFIALDMFAVKSFDYFDDGPVQSFSSQFHFRPETIMIPRSPESNRHHLVDFFLKYHLEVIRPGHYFWYYDYIQLCKCWLPAMAATSLALRHALVAFSALVYSIKVVGSSGEVAFFYYALALKELRIFLDGPLSPEECNVAIATALQLSSFEVHSLP